MTPDEYTEQHGPRSLRVVAILETMWGDEAGEAERYFRINPRNHSGKCLYALVGNARLLVTNACREKVTSANQHGKPDPDWLKVNMMKLDPITDLWLVCGKVAQSTFERAYFMPRGKVIKIPHPAARFVWTPELTASIKSQIEAVHDDAAGEKRG